MEQFYFEEPSIERKGDSIEYVKEHELNNSLPHETSGLDTEYIDYEKWLNKLQLIQHEETRPSNYCCGIQYFLVRKNDNKVVGTFNLRWDLNEWMINYGGHIGYGIRPSERRKGYNKINLYLGLLKAKERGIDRVLLTVDDDNLGSINTILALGGILENTIQSYEEKNKLLRRYWINVDESIDKYKDIYEKYIANK